MNVSAGFSAFARRKPILALKRAYIGLLMFIAAIDGNIEDPLLGLHQLLQADGQISRANIAL